jgi:ABC-2 type transport system ATP-binding protein
MAGTRARYLFPMAAITTEGLRKVYPVASSRRRPPAGTPPYGMGPPAGRPPGGSNGRALVALEGLDLTVHEGEFFGLLGPNGAGKTTTIGILTTRVRASAGRATVAGADVIADPVGVRRRIGVRPLRDAYFGLARREAGERALALLEQLGIGEKAHEKVDALSGGQQQRLMIARALIHEPDVIFLDEPTVGLDPQARLALWDVLRELHRQGRTIVMTTHYMTEAEQLCDRLAIVDHGRLLAIDTTAALKAKAPGGTLIDLALDGEAGELVERAQSLAHVLAAESVGDLLRVRSTAGGRIVSALIELAEGAGRQVRNITLEEPSLETLFISLTGRKLE